jgi:hypothetical protein
MTFTQRTKRQTGPEHPTFYGARTDIDMAIKSVHISKFLITSNVKQMAKYMVDFN